MSEMSQFSDEVRVELARQHDNLLSWTMLSRKERRRQGVRAPKRELERMLFATGMAIAQSGEPVYATAKDFLEANPE